MIKNFSFAVPQEFIFGVGSLQKLPELLKKNQSSKILLISDRGLEKLGVVEKVVDIITDANLACETFLDVETNPSCETVDAATEKYKETNNDSIIVLGAGSPMDVAKAFKCVSHIWW